jgi:uncharacterized membrane protein (UPF0127 family)
MSKSATHLRIQNIDRPLRTQLFAIDCASFLCRLRGLTFQYDLPFELGLLLKHERESRFNTAIHMLGVFYDLSVIWIDSKHQVVDVQLARRWHPFYIPARPAQYVLEISAQRIADFQVGERVTIRGVRSDNEK